METNVDPKALTVCRICGQKAAFLVTQEDPKCPNCGSPFLPPPNGMEAMTSQSTESVFRRPITNLSIIHVIGIAFLLGIGALWFFSDDPNRQPASPPADAVDSTQRVNTAIRAHQVIVGMSESSVIAAWGEPEHKNNTTTAAGVTSQWVYSSDRFVYLDNGRVTAVQTTSR